MSENTLMLGAPSLCGKDARDDLEQTLQGVAFPMTFTATNRLPFHVSFPEAGYLYLKASGHDGSTGTFTVESKEAFARFVTDVQAIAELNHADAALDVVLPTVPAPRAKTAKAEA